MNNSCCSVKQGKVILNFLLFEHILGRGAFGEVWQVNNKRDQKKYACKVEPKSSNQQLLSEEIKALNLLQDSPFFPKIHLFGSDSRNNYLVMDLYHSDLESYRWRKGGSLPQSQVIQIAYSMIEILEDLHAHGIVHRDIKPDNITISDVRLEKLFLIDFGLAKRFISKDGQHCQCVQNKGLTGTVRYASANAIYGTTLSRRDDLESLFYSLIYLMKGTLPWMQQYPTKDIKKTNTLAYKLSLKPEQESEWCDIFKGFFDFFYHVRSLGFREKPDYNYLKSLFRGPKIVLLNLSVSDQVVEEINTEDQRNRTALQMTWVPLSIMLSSNHRCHESSENLSSADEGQLTSTQVKKIHSEVRMRKPLSG